jgi:hypothetical protein
MRPRSGARWSGRRISRCSKPGHKLPFRELTTPCCTASYFFGPRPGWVSQRHESMSADGSFPRKRPWYPLQHEHTTAIPGRTADDARQHARQRRAVARGVVLGAGCRSVARRLPVPKPSCSAPWGDRGDTGRAEGQAEIGPGPAAPAPPVRFSGEGLGPPPGPAFGRTSGLPCRRRLGGSSSRSHKGHPAGRNRVCRATP